MHCCISPIVSKWPDQYGHIGLLRWSAIAALYSPASEAAASHMQASISILSTKHVLRISSSVSLAWIRYSGSRPLPRQPESRSRVVRQICLPTNGITLYSERPEADCSYLSLADNTCTLLSPRRVLTLTRGLQDKILACLSTTHYNTIPIPHLRRLLPSTVQEWGKLRILPAGDTIRASSLQASAGDRRDCTFVRVCTTLSNTTLIIYSTS